MTRRMGWALALAVWGCTGGTAGADGADGAGRPGAATVVVLVRHGEKTAEPGDDPPLSAAGRARAGALAAVLADAGVSGAIVSQRRRTAETAAPLLRRTAIPADVVPIGGPLAAHADSVAALIRTRYRGRSVLVVGHTHTVPAIIAALGGAPMPELCDAAYGNLFVLVLREHGSPELIRGHFGASDPPGADVCPAPRKG